MTLQEYKQQTIGDKYEMPETLSKLFEFEEEYEREWYSESFFLDTQEDDYSYLLRFDTEKKAEEYKKYIKKFATVDGTGGFCAFWIREGEKDLENVPIINYGSEGSIRIVAKNIKELLKILTFDIELMDGSCYKFKKDYEESEYKDEYIDWLKIEFNIDPVKDLEEDKNHGESEDIEKIIKEAEEMYKEKFIEWHLQYEDIRKCFDE